MKIIILNIILLILIIVQFYLKRIEKLSFDDTLESLMPKRLELLKLFNQLDISPQGELDFGSRQFGLFFLDSRFYEQTGLFKSGMIVPFTKDTIPIGWVLCDGQNGTPDLRNRFILGSGHGSGLTNRNKGDIGGEEKVTLVLNQIPNHSHSIKTIQGNEHNMDGDNGGSGGWETRNGHYGTTTTEGVGGGQSHNNMPPYVILNYIMKT